MEEIAIFVHRKKYKIKCTGAEHTVVKNDERTFTLTFDHIECDGDYDQDIFVAETIQRYYAEVENRHISIDEAIQEVTELYRSGDVYFNAVYVGAERINFGTISGNMDIKVRNGFHTPKLTIGDVECNDIPLDGGMTVSRKQTGITVNADNKQFEFPNQKNT